jgi:ankyrin repeat protein
VVSALQRAASTGDAEEVRILLSKLRDIQEEEPIATEIDKKNVPGQGALDAVDDNGTCALIYAVRDSDYASKKMGMGRRRRFLTGLLWNLLSLVVLWSP